jgi:hypothetical protein
MRVNYTLPGFLPAEAAPAETARTGDSPFRARLKFVPAPSWNWESLLHLEDAPINAAWIGPPPAPGGFEMRDAAADRLRWRQLLDRQVANLQDDPQSDAPPGEDAKAIERMLSLLMRFRDAEDEITARYLAEPEG